MTSTGKATDQNLTEVAVAPGNIPQGNDPACGAYVHRFDRYWDCDLFYGTERREKWSDWSMYGLPKLPIESWKDIYRAPIRFWEHVMKHEIPRMACWCVQSHHTDYVNEKLWDAHQRFNAENLRRDNAIQYAKNGRQQGPRELTLTYSPAWFDEDHLAQEAFKTALTRLCKYYRDELNELRAVGEFHKSGRSHLHIMYSLRNGGKFTDKNITRAYPHWKPKSNHGGHHSLVASVSDFRGYIEKDLQDAWLDVTYPNADDPSHTTPA